MNLVKILVVDDDSTHIQLVEYLLGNNYSLTIANNGEEALAAFRHEIPDLVLLDISMPGMDGYEVCRAIKEEDYNDDVAVIFVSGSDSMEERTKGYEVGGDDYVVKPFQVGEFRKKINATARFQRTKKALEKQQEDARSVAFESMKEASQYGQVLQFLKDSFHQDDIPSLIDALFRTLDQFSLNACIQVRLPDKTLSVRPFEQACSPIELELFGLLREKGRIFEFGDRLIVNDNHVSLLVKNLPTDDENLTGRLKDVLVVVVEGFDARLMDIQRKKAVTTVLERLDSAMNMVKSRFTDYTRKNVEIMDDLLINMNESMHILGLTDEQEQYYFGLVERALRKLNDTCDDGQDISEEISRVMGTVKPLID